MAVCFENGGNIKQPNMKALRSILGAQVQAWGTFDRRINQQYFHWPGLDRLESIQGMDPIHHTPQKAESLAVGLTTGDGL
jgi:hypothetical protein